MSKEIRYLPQKSASKELASEQGRLDLVVERETDIDGIGMGVLRDGTPFLTGRGLARLVDIENLHIRTISQEWNDLEPKPRIAAIKGILAKRGIHAPEAHFEIQKGGMVYHAFSDAVCLAVLEYYAFDAARPREKARDNYRLLAGQALRDFIYSHVGYDPSGRHQHRFDKWHERLALNYQSAPKGFFHVFNEAHSIIYELIQAGADIGEKMVVDISIGQHWSKFWEANSLNEVHGQRTRYPHRYPPSHPQANSNPQDSWCYPLASLGAYREWLHDEYLGRGKFKNYLDAKVRRGELPPSIAQLAISTLAPELLE